MDKIKIFYDGLDDKLCDFLINSKELHRSFLFPSCDESLSFVLNYHHKLSTLFKTSYSNFGSEILSKVFQKEYACKSNLNVPREINIRNIKESDLPVIIKPKDSLKYGKEYFSIIYKMYLVFHLYRSTGNLF